MTVTMEEAVAQFDDLLDRVAGGERVTILRDGIPVADIVPPDEADAPTGLLSPGEAVERIQELRSRQEPMSHAELLELVAEGRK